MLVVDRGEEVCALGESMRELTFPLGSDGWEKSRTAVGGFEVESWLANLGSLTLVLPSCRGWDSSESIHWIKDRGVAGAVRR